jgi:hypothetical protein
MNFENAWRYLLENQPLDLETSGGTPFKVVVSESSISYKSEKDQKRPQSKKNFHQYFRLWFERGFRRKKDYKNFGDQKSESTRFRYFSAVFRYIEGALKVH